MPQNSERRMWLTFTTLKTIFKRVRDVNKYVDDERYVVKTNEI